MMSYIKADLVNLALVLFTMINSQVTSAGEGESDQDWWKHAVFYQIYPRSFKDSNGDGVGDLQGIISKMDYISETGFTAIWLSPIYKSPQADMGYDISDYREVDPLFGTLEDFDQLIKEAHKRNVKVVMDYVPNHTSNEHEWFQLSENSTEGYEDYYVWRNASDDGSVPNNWVSIFQGFAWTWSDLRQQYYLHQFAEEQPDLNYRNPKVVEEMKDVLKFWLDRGVDGFRIDAVTFLYEDEDFLDEPLSGVEGISANNTAYLNHIYTVNQPETYDLVYEFRTFVDDYVKENGGDSRVLMTEAYADLEHTMLYYGTPDGEKLGAHFSFNFQFLSKIQSAKDVSKLVDDWYEHMPSIYTPNWVIGNHDNHRVATRFGAENVDGFNMLVTLLPGVAVTYNGEEIGMEDGVVEFEQCADPTVCDDKESFVKFGRDPERTPFQWDNSSNAGFSDAEGTWLPVSEKYTETNLAYQNINGTSSHYNVYKSLLQLRKEDPFCSGRPKILAISDGVVAFTLTQNESYVVVINLHDEEEIIDLPTYFDESLPFVEIAIASVDSKYSNGNTYSAKGLVMDGHESFVAKFVSNNEDVESEVDSLIFNEDIVPTTSGANVDHEDLTLPESSEVADILPTEFVTDYDEIDDGDVKASSTVVPVDHNDKDFDDEDDFETRIDSNRDEIIKSTPEEKVQSSTVSASGQDYIAAPSNIMHIDKKGPLTHNLSIEPITSSNMDENRSNNKEDETKEASSSEETGINEIVSSATSLKLDSELANRSHNLNVPTSLIVTLIFFILVRH